MVFVLIMASAPIVASDYQTPLEQFFKLYQADRKNRAEEQLYFFNRDRKDNSNDDVIISKQAMLREATEALGLYYGQELLGTHQVGERFKHLSYLLLHQESPVRIEFQFYKPQDHWLLIDFQVDNNLALELKDLARKDIAGFLVQGDVAGLSQPQ